MYTYISEKIQARISTIQLREDGVMHIDIKADESFVVGDVHELIEAVRKIGEGKKFPNLITVGEHTTPDHAARVFASSKEASIYKIADAFVIHSLPQQLVANFYVRINKPFVPTKYFMRLDEADRWIKSFL